MTFRSNVLGTVGLGLGVLVSAAPASAQAIHGPQQLQDIARPLSVPVQDYRERRDDYRRDDDYGRPPPGPPGGRFDELRERMFDLRRACEDGDRRACVRFGIIIGENRERRAQWRREHPDLFWWER